jgi:hypothetical protein
MRLFLAIRSRVSRVRNLERCSCRVRGLLSSRGRGVGRVRWTDVPFAQFPWRSERDRYVVSFTTELPFQLPIEDQWTVAIGQRMN